MLRHDDDATIERSTSASISAIPVLMADTRKPLGKSNAAVRIIHSDCTYSTDGHSSPPRNAATAIKARVCTNSFLPAGRRSTNTLSRKCSLRSIASTDPSIATHKNEIDTISSIHTIGAENT